MFESNRSRMDLSQTIIPPLDQPYPYQRGCLTEDGRWMPFIPRKSVDVFNDRTRIILLTGARKSGKTISGVCNKVARHLWEVNGSCLGVVGKSLRNAGSGPWKDLLEFTIPGWLDAGIGMAYIKTPRLTSDTHERYAVLNNCHGGESKVCLLSLNVEQDVEKLVKSLRFSMLWISEVDQFQRHSIDILLDQLRVVGVDYADHQMIMDCNPPEDGDDHWLHSAMINRDESNSRLMKESAVYNFSLDDNPFLPPEERENLEEKWKYDKLKYRRFVLGHWVKDMSVGWFDQVFSPDIAIVGDCCGMDKSEWEVIVPSSGTATLITGTDFGDLNHATTFLFCRTSATRDTIFDIFDEVVSLDRPMSLRAYCEMLWARIQHWNKWMSETYKVDRVMWRHWVDSSAMNFRSSSDTTDAMTAYQVSGRRMVMRAAKKGPGSIMQRIDLTKRLFHGGRLFISAHCEHNIDWARNLKKGNSKRDAVKPGLQCRHAFDAATYALASEIPIELNIKEEPTRDKGGLVMV